MRANWTDVRGHNGSDNASLMEKETARNQILQDFSDPALPSRLCVSTSLAVFMETLYLAVKRAAVSGPLAGQQYSTLPSQRKSSRILRAHNHFGMFKASWVLLYFHIFTVSSSLRPLRFNYLWREQVYWWSQ